jgi:hypothetical protein
VGPGFEGGGIGGGCDTFGFAFFDSTNGQELMVGFNLANATSDRFEETVGCFEVKGVSNCLGFGEVWRNTTHPTRHQANEL